MIALPMITLHMSSVATAHSLTHYNRIIIIIFIADGTYVYRLFWTLCALEGNSTAHS